MRDSGQLLQLVHTGLVKAGYDVGAIYRELGFQAEGLPFKEIRMHHPMQVVFWETVESVTGERDIALKICPHLPPYRAEVLEYLMYSSPTMADGCLRAFKYLRLVSDALNVRIEREHGPARLVIVSSPERTAVLRHTEICAVWSIIQFAKHATEGAFHPQAIRLSYEQRSPIEDYENLFGCPVAFNAPHCEVDFPASMLDWTSPRWDPDLLRVQICRRPAPVSPSYWPTFAIDWRGGYWHRPLKPSITSFISPGSRNRAPSTEHSNDGRASRPCSIETKKEGRTKPATLPAATGSWMRPRPGAGFSFQETNHEVKNTAGPGHLCRWMAGHLGGTGRCQR